MLFKYYAAEVIDVNSKIIGSRVQRTLFFNSPVTAFNDMLTTIDKEKAPINFRRIK